MKLRICIAAAMSLLATQAMAADQTKPVATAPQAAVVSATQQSAPVLATDKDKISYSIGVDLGMHLKAQGIVVDSTVLTRGINDALSGNKLAMAPERIAATLVALQKDLAAKQQAALVQVSAQNLKDGQAYMAANKAKPGVMTTASGLQYRVVEQGKGTKPVDGDLVTVDYTGSFINGKVFDSSNQHGKPVTFPLTQNAIIKGWVEALKLMPTGSTYEIVIPPSLGFGAQGMPGAIGPNQTLVFKVHLVSIKKPNQANS